MHFYFKSRFLLRVEALELERFRKKKTPKRTEISDFEPGVAYPF